MKKILFVIFTLIGISIAANAQFPTTTAKPIANGCGAEGDWKSRVGGTAGAVVDGMRQGNGYKAQQESCNQHDRDYYNGVDKNKADNDFQKRSPTMGTVVKNASSSNDAYQNAQKSRETSKQLQSTWEKENQQCLDANNYKVTYK